MFLHGRFDLQIRDACFSKNLQPNFDGTDFLNLYLRGDLIAEIDVVEKDIASAAG